MTTEQETNPDEPDSSTATLISAWQKFTAGDMSEAALLFRSAIKQAESEFGEKSVELSNVYTDASTGLFLAGLENYEEATEVLQRSLDLQTARDGELSAGCARVYRQLSSMHKASQNYSKALHSLRKAIDMFEALAAFGSSTDGEELAQMYSDLRELTYKEDKANQGENEDPSQGAAQIIRLRACAERDEDDNEDEG